MIFVYLVCSLISQLLCMKQLILFIKFRYLSYLSKNTVFLFLLLFFEILYFNKNANFCKL